MPRGLLIAAPTDFSKDAIGGTSAIIEEVLSVLDMNCLLPHLVGASERDVRIGEWGTVVVAGREVPFLPVSRSIKSGLVPARLALPIGMVRARDALASARIDVVYAHCPEAALAVRGLLPRVPIILHVHGTASPLSFSRFKAARHPAIQALYQASVMRAALRVVSGVFVTSDEGAFRQFCKSWGQGVARKARRVPAMVNTEVFAPISDRTIARQELGVASSDPIVVSVGRIERTKGAGDAMVAFQRLREGGARAKYVIVGDGSYRETLERMVTSVGLGSDVVFTGPLARDRVARVLGASDLFLSGSWQEGFSVALLEALACGLPAVATDVGGVRELIEDGINGYIVRSRDVLALSEALRAAIAKRENLRAASRERAMPYGTERIAGSVIADVLAFSSPISERKRAPGRT